MKNLLYVLAALLVLPVFTGCVTSETITRYPNGKEVVEKKGLFTPTSDRYAQIRGVYGCHGCYTYGSYSYVPYDYYYGRRAGLAERLVTVVAVEFLREIIHQEYGGYGYGRDYGHYGGYNSSRRLPRHVEDYLDYESRFDSRGQVLPPDVRRTLYTSGGRALRNYGPGGWQDVNPSTARRRR